MEGLSFVVVPRESVRVVWPYMEEDVKLYATKSPHYVGEPQEVLEWLQDPQGDELAVVSLHRRYAGFITFKAQDLEPGERWGTICMILLKPEAQAADVLPALSVLLEKELKVRGCNVMNYMTARKGFARLAPRMGFKARIVEWMKEI